MLGKKSHALRARPNVLVEISTAVVGGHCRASRQHRSGQCVFLSNKTLGETAGLFCIVKNNAHRVAVPGSHSAHAMAHVHAVGSAFPLDRAVMHGEQDAAALTKRNYFRPRLHAGPLFDQQELAAGEMRFGLGQKYRHLQWKNMLAVQILMQCVVNRPARIAAEAASAGSARLYGSAQ